MKKLILLLTILFSVNAFALPIPYIELEENDRALYPMQGDYQVVYQTPDCPIDAVCLPSTVVSINYILGGCLDRAFTFEKVNYGPNGNIDVYVTALNISNAKSDTVKCIAAPTYTQKIHLGGGMISEETIKVHFMGIPEGGLE